MSDQFIISWCNEGLEGVVPVSDIERETTMAILSNQHKPTSAGQILNMMVLRANANVHRAYEIYAITASDGITADDITEMFENCPQTAAETIRRIGHKIHSSRIDPSRVKIT
jgi:hypothetical protein